MWERLFVDADTGALLTVDLRFPNAAQRRYLRARDEHCRFPGCRRPIRKRLSDADHTIDHCLGGPTCVCNLAYLCEYHHTLKHHSAWTVVQRPGGVLEWTSPTGRTCTDVPLPVVRFIHDGDPPPF
ncbi:HNH endonuclease signature motif containing protein [Microbacterium barkeri]|uniref:HNH endonuclease n=1 Tax=Microbacterium barkeri TaxID=33917 RepID=UPI0024AF198D|nr:HNH endonuclease signature motif containing protein [Microbacterium barkeri]MDI6944119.1 HNH endonuclease signature motif containing protein [Microbacterium barkeri]